MTAWADKLHNQAQFCHVVLPKAPRDGTPAARRKQTSSASERCTCAAVWNGVSG
eukprot:gene11554-biopygen506